MIVCRKDKVSNDDYIKPNSNLSSSREKSEGRFLVSKEVMVTGKKHKRGVMCTSNSVLSL